MKKIIYSLLFAALFSACSTDFLDRNPLDKPSTEAFGELKKMPWPQLQGVILVGFLWMK